MRIPLLTFILLLFCLQGCSQVSTHDFNNPAKIPIDPKRWYQLNNTTGGLEQLFNKIPNEKPHTGWGTVLANYDSYYPVLDGERISIDSIMFFDWEGTHKEHPFTVYAILQDWQKVRIGVFTGQRYNAWNGPDPDSPDVYALAKPVTNIRYIVINTSGDFPGELEFYGSYTPPNPITQAVKKPAQLKNFMGVNAFEWDFLDPFNHLQLGANRLPAIKNFTGIRHYMDWEKIEIKEGVYSFNPTTSGGWNYDIIYQYCKDQGIEVLACLKTIPPWMEATYPKDQRDNENIPTYNGKDQLEPMSYIEQARAGFQFAARYGNNQNVDTRLLTLDPSNQVKTGMGLIKYIECDNERDKWWKGRYAYQTAREYAANLSAFYDGHKGQLGPGAGVKNADTSMKVVIAGMANPNTDYVRGMIDWCKEFRGMKPDGTVDLPWDIINYHYYSNDASDITGKRQTKGVAPELSRAEAIAGEFIQMAHQYAGDMPVWVTEAGYDINLSSPQRAISLNGRPTQETQADWILRTSLTYARAGIQKLFFYELKDDNEGNGVKFATSGLVNEDRSNRPAANYLRQVSRMFGKYSYVATISRDPIVDKYEYNGQYMYMLVVPDQRGRTATYSLSLDNAATAYQYTPSAQTEQMNMIMKPTNYGRLDVMVTETPVFITTYDATYGQ